MCNEIKCAVHENVQMGCTGDVHIAAVWTGLGDWNMCNGAFGMDAYIVIVQRQIVPSR